MVYDMMQPQLMALMNGIQHNAATFDGIGKHFYKNYIKDNHTLIYVNVSISLSETLSEGADHLTNDHLLLYGSCTEFAYSKCGRTIKQKMFYLNT